MFIPMNTHVVVWRNKPDLDSMSFDDLYNNLKIVEQEVKGTASSSLNSKNMAFLSSPNSTNEVNTAYGVSTANTQVTPASTQVSTASTQEEVPTNMALTAFSDSEIDLSYSGLEEFKQPDFESYGPKSCEIVSKNASEDIPNELKESPNAPLVKDRVSDNKDCSVKYPIMIEKSFDHVQANCNYHQGERVVTRNNYTRVNHNYYTKKAHPSAHKNMTPRAVSMKTGLRPLNIVRHVNNAHPKTIVYSARSMSHFSKLAPSTVRRPIQKKTSLTNRSFHQKGNTVKGKVNTTRPKAVNTTRTSPAVVNAVRANQVNVVKALACWVWRPTKPNDASVILKRHNYINVQEDQGYVDSRCSRHMTWNMSYLSDFKEIDGGYVTFGGGANGGRITSKRTIYTGNLDFEDVYFVKELKFNLFSVSQIVPRRNNMYSVDMKNIVPKESLTCIVAKATLDESMLWHRRLGHINFKNINKLVKDNLLRATKDETACILKKFIIEIENLVDKKVKNRVLVVKPHNKNPYELFRARTHALSFMKPLGCHVTILNTLDHLEKFDGKCDEGFFVGYSLTSKAFRVYNTRTRKVEENFHIRFLEDKPSITGNGPKWLFDIDVLTNSMNYMPVVAGTNSNDFVGTEESIGTGQSNKEAGSSQDYILLPLWKDRSLFDFFSKNTSNDKPQPSSDVGNKDDEGVSKDSGIDDQEKPETSINDVNTVGTSINTTSTNLNTGSLNINTVSPTVSTATPEATHADLFSDELEGDMSNITNTYQVPSTPNTRIHKDHSLDLVIGNAELLQFKLQKVWILVDLPKGKKAIGTKWVFQKVRLVAQGYTQEEGIDFDEIFAHIARIKAIRLFLAYASFIRFMVYQIDMKSAFLYGRIKEEVYMCQPLGFEDPDYPDKVYKVVKALYSLHQAPRACQDKYVIKVLRKFNSSYVKSASTPVDIEKSLIKDADGDDYVYVPDFKSHLRDSPFELVAYTNGDYAGASLDRTSTTGGCQFLGCELIS
nr:putative ribonuclease H-like domain-containing protein [Tanacetum cinerariifolium]